MFPFLLTCFGTTQLPAQRLPADIMPSGIYTFVWAGVDTNVNHIVRSGLMPATLPGMGHVARGSLHIKPGTPQRFVLSWTVTALGAPDSAKQVVGSIEKGTIQGPIASTDEVFLLNGDAGGTATGVVHHTKGVYYLLPGMNVRIALKPPGAP